MTDKRRKKRLKRIEISPELIEEFLTTGHAVTAFEIIAGLPEGARLVTAGTLPQAWERRPGDAVEYVWLTFEHDTFPVCEEAEYPENLAVKLQHTAKAPVPTTTPFGAGTTEITSCEASRTVLFEFELADGRVAGWEMKAAEARELAKAITTAAGAAECGSTVQ